MTDSQRWLSGRKSTRAGRWQVRSGHQKQGSGAHFSGASVAVSWLHWLLRPADGSLPTRPCAPTGARVSFDPTRPVLAKLQHPDPIFLPRVKGENYFALFLHSSHLPCLPGLGLSVQIQLFRSNQHAGDPTTCTSQSRFPAAVTLASRSPPPPRALGHLLAELRPTLQANKER